MTKHSASTPMKSVRFALAAILLVQPLSAAFAADWQLVLSDRSRRVEIDRGSIFASDGGTKVSWSRVVLSPAEAARSGHTMIKALNRYDCANRTIVTVKRVFLDANANVVREESVADQTPLVVTRNSVDERMWREVCSPPTSAAELDRIAGRIADLAAASSTAAAAPAAVARPQPVPTSEAEGRLQRADTRSAPDAAPAAPPPATVLPPLPATPPAARTAAPAAAPASAPRAAAAPEKAVEPIRRAAAQVARRAEARPAPRAAPKAPVRSERRAAAARSTPPRSTAVASRSAAPGPDWSYDGANGPQAWGKLRPEWKLCSSGSRQSPIDLRDGVGVELNPVRFDYRPSAFRVRDTGKTVQVDVVENMGIEVRGTRYVLERFTLHRPSMDRIEGRAEDMAVYLEHRSATGDVAILSVQLAAEGAANSALQAVWNNLPLERGRDFLPAASIDLAAFVPASGGHYMYQGSLPTPPCTEDVLWVVMKQPVSISPEQLAVFARLYPRSGRPIQPGNGRLILESR